MASTKSNNSSLKLDILVSFYCQSARYAFKRHNQYETVISFTQFPLMLVWAATIHKSQGKAYQVLVLNFTEGGAFTHGQTYVTLSRLEDLDGLYLKSSIYSEDIIIDKEVVEFMNKAKTIGSVI